MKFDLKIFEELSILAGRKFIKIDDLSKTSGISASTLNKLKVAYKEQVMGAETKEYRPTLNLKNLPLLIHGLEKLGVNNNDISDVICEAAMEEIDMIKKNVLMMTVTSDAGLKIIYGELLELNLNKEAE